MLRLAFAAACALGLAFPALAEAPQPDRRVEALMQRMTLEEKVGQLSLVSMLPRHEAGYEALKRKVRDGEVSGFFNIHGSAHTRQFQELARTGSRLGIPLFMGLDVLHGYRTIFPTPLGQAASWDMEAIRKAERISTVEATAAGLNMVLAPMLDVSRDARWGRVVEGAGESPWLAARIAEARVAGVEGGGPRMAPDAALACVKHFGANGAVEGGRDYTAQDLSERAIRETYLPPFKAAVDAGARCMMAAFNAPDGAPTVANPRLLTDVLRKEWGFDGVVMSDFAAIDELAQHGFVPDSGAAARLAFTAGTDLDMQSGAYLKNLPRLVREGAVPEAALDAAVRRVLTLKAELGLFDDPDRGVQPERERAILDRPEHRQAALELAEKSFVLLRNKNNVLPFAKDTRRVALIGPFGDSGADTLGPWAARGEPKEAVTLKKGLEQRLGAERVAFTPGGTAEKARDAEIAAAVETARRADVVVLALGERFNHSGEAASRADLALPEGQMRLARAVLALGRPTVAIIFAGRPLVLTDLAEIAPAILYAWQPGTMGGLALARMIMGDVAPSGRLPMTFPRSVGQAPIHHEQPSTGRPAVTPAKPFLTGYADESHLPLFPFGFGLGYTDFSYGKPTLDRATLRAGETAIVRVKVANTGERDGVATVQLYVRPTLARVAPPMRALRGFGRVALAPGEARDVEIRVAANDLGYWRPDGSFGPPEGPVEIMTGPDAGDVARTTLELAP